MEIIERLFLIMEEKNIKASELAKHLNINQSVVSTWKSRLKNPPSEMIIPICELIDIEPYYLLTGNNIENKSNNELEELYNQLNDEYKAVAKYKIKELIKEQELEYKSKFKNAN